MATKTLIEKIEALPPEKKAEVERFVDTLRERAVESKGGSDLVRRLRERRERILHDHGLVDSLPIIRELRERGE